MTQGARFHNVGAKRFIFTFHDVFALLALFAIFGLKVEKVLKSPFLKHFLVSPKFCLTNTQGGSRSKRWTDYSGAQEGL